MNFPFIQLLRSIISKYTFTLFCILFLSGSLAVAEEIIHQKNPDPELQKIMNESVVDRFGLSGNARIRGRTAELADGTHRNWVDLRLVGDGYINLTDDGCLQLRARVSTGNTYNSDSAATGIGELEQNINLYMRYLYVDYTCYLNKVAVQAGAMQVKTQGISGAYQNGWVDGFRVSYKFSSQNEVFATVGSVNDMNTPNVFNRDHNGVNYLQIFTRQSISKDLKAAADLTNLDQTTYFNLTLDLILKDYFSFLTSLRVDIGTTEGQYQSSVIEFTKVMDQWRISVGYSHKEAFKGDEDTLIRLPTDTYYTVGHFFYININQQINKRWSVNFRAKNDKKLKSIELGLKYQF
jgi:hypothetical protein